MSDEPRDDEFDDQLADDELEDELEDDEFEDELEDDTELAIVRFRRTATGSVLAAGLFGLRDALESRPEKDEPAIIAEAPQPFARDDFDLELDPEHPERSIVRLHQPPPPTPPSD